MVSSSRSAAADTSATAASLIYLSQPVKAVAPRSRRQSAGKKNRSNQLQWLECWLTDPGETFNNQAQRELVDLRARFTSGGCHS
ncbi:MAG: hypothetical protein VYE46_08950 [Cyanobacteriota bacterium]|nr:hypothetical protein [Cyanobacteriota bacterium]